MKEAQLSRMNFLKQSSHGMTYRGMLYGFVVWCALLALLYGGQTLRHFGANRDLESNRAKLISLEDEKARLMDLIKAQNKLRTGMTGKQDLATILMNRPKWDRMLKEIKKVLPADVWLDSIAVKEGGEGWYDVTMTGHAKTQRDLNDFVMKLDGGGFFDKTTLDKAKLADGQVDVFDFALSTRPDAKKLTEERDAGN